MLPGRRLDPLDPRVQREQRGSRHAVLQAGPGRAPQRLRARRQALVERADPSPERQDLPPRDPQSRLRRTHRRVSSSAVASVAWISVSPVKGLALRQLDECELTEAGVAGDRAFFLVDEDGRLVNSKGLGALQQIVPRFDDECSSCRSPTARPSPSRSPSTARSTRSSGAWPFPSAWSSGRGARRSPTSPGAACGSSGPPGRRPTGCAAAPRPCSALPPCARSLGPPAWTRSTGAGSG